MYSFSRIFSSFSCLQYALTRLLYHLVAISLFEDRNEENMKDMEGTNFLHFELQI